MRGGSETIHSNRALVNVIRTALETTDIPSGIIQFIDNPDRQLVADLLTMYNEIDMLIPRGGPNEKTNSPSVSISVSYKYATPISLSLSPSTGGI